MELLAELIASRGEETSAAGTTVGAITAVVAVVAVFVVVVDGGGGTKEGGDTSMSESTADETDVVTGRERAPVAGATVAVIFAVVVKVFVDDGGNLTGEVEETSMSDSTADEANAITGREGWAPDATVDMVVVGGTGYARDASMSDCNVGEVS